MVDALVNLLSNAHKYSDGAPDITLSAQADRRWVHISVADRGIGIPVTEQRRIFQKFYRVDERLSQAMEGTGLGLAIVRHVARAHGGQVNVESAPGEGSTFTLTLPRPAVESAAEPRSDERASA
jgi:signal transduction histidine kinase